jgi:hypothetical protein
MTREAALNSLLSNPITRRIVYSFGQNSGLDPHHTLTDLLAQLDDEERKAFEEHRSDLIPVLKAALPTVNFEEAIGDLLAGKNRPASKFTYETKTLESVPESLRGALRSLPDGAGYRLEGSAEDLLAMEAHWKAVPANGLLRTDAGLANAGGGADRAKFQISKADVSNFPMYKSLSEEAAKAGAVVTIV